MFVEQRDPAVCGGSNNMGGRGEMTKAPISLQDLRRNLYVKAKVEPNWRFWRLHVHVCKRETLHEAYERARSNNGAPGIDGVTFEAIEESEWRVFWSRYGMNWFQTRIGPCELGRRRFRRTGAVKSAFFRFLQSGIEWSRGHSSSFWSRSSKPTSNRGRMDIVRNGQRMNR